MVLYGIPEDLVITLRLDHREEYFSGGRIGLEGLISVHRLSNSNLRKYLRKYGGVVEGYHPRGIIRVKK